MTIADLVSFAEELSMAARLETLPRWARGCMVENKASDGFDPVTEGDRAAERAMRKLITSRFPDHSVSGEEWPDRPGTASFGWSLDPIDGTRAFICGLPTWVTLIALLEDGEPILGLIDAPCLGETYVGHGKEAYLRRNGTRARIRTGTCNRLAEARLSTTDPFLFTPAAAAAFDRLRSSAQTVRYGLDGYGYARLAAGSLDLIVEGGLKPHDYQALIPIIRGAGGTVGDWRGGEDFSDGNIIAASTRGLYEEAVGYFSDLE